MFVVRFQWKSLLNLYEDEDLFSLGNDLTFYVK